MATGTRARDGRGLRIGFWVAIVLVGLLLAALTAAVRGTGQTAEQPLDPGSARAGGAKALVRVLEQRGTDVRATDRLRDVGGGTVLVDDARGVIAPETAREIVRGAAHVVLLTSSPATLAAFDVDAEPAASVSDGATTSTRRCAVPGIAAAGSVTADGVGFTVDDPSATTCAPTGSGADRVWGIVRTETRGGDLTLVGTTAAFRNDTVTTAGNAALALNLLGTDDALTWYTPVPGTPDAAPSLGELAPPWVPSALVLLGAVAVAAAVWRGRRLGPLVVERLPIVVRASETTEGRARLYARTRDRTHALDTLRIAAVRRSARQLGLPRSAHVDDVVRAVARATGRSDADVGAVLVGGATADDAALVAGAAALDDLERAVRRAATGERGSTADAAATPPKTTDRPGARP